MQKSATDYDVRQEHNIQVGLYKELPK